MPVQVFGADATFAILNRVFYEQQPLFYETYTYTVAKIGAEGAHAVARGLGEGYAPMHEARLSAMLLEKLGLLPNPALQGELANYLAAVGKANVGIVALQLGQILSGLEGATGELAIYSAAAARWNDELAASHALSSNPSNKGYATVEPFNNGQGATLELTSGPDMLRGTLYGDVFLAQSPGLLGSADVIEGGGRGMAGNVLLATLAGGDQVVPTLSNIESVYITAGAGTHFGAEKSTGIKQLMLDAATGGSALFTGVGRDAKVGIQNSLGGTALTVHFKAPWDKLAPVALKLADAAGADEIIVPDVVNLHIASMAGSVVATTVNSARITVAAAEEIVLTGNQALTTTVTGAHVEVINAGSMQAALDLAFATTGATPIGIIGGQVADRITLNDASGGRAAIDAGEGADLVTIGARNTHSITLGKGADVLAITGLASPGSWALGLDSAATLGRSVIEVTDFVSGVDQIRLSATTATAKAAPGSAQLAAISASSSLLEAAALAAGTAGAHKAIAFRYGADTYILVNDATAALGAHDSLVKLTGVPAVADADWTMA
jgi:hypothetical protein